MSQAQVVAVLTKARDYVNQGWIQGMGKSHDGKRRCALQAITDSWAHLVQQGNPDPTVGERWVYDQAVNLLVEAAGDIPSIPYWNDKIARNQREVVRTFDRAIALAEGKTDAELEAVPSAPVSPITLASLGFTIPPIVMPSEALPTPVVVEAPKSVVQKVKELVGV
jgi:hypothetical protein